MATKTFAEKDWVWSLLHKARGRIVEVEELWGQIRYRVWLPSLEAVVFHHAKDLQENAPLAANGNDLSAKALRFAAVAGRVSELRHDEKLLAPLNAAIISLPHQIRTLKRVISSPQIRFLLADEVGLGKTIEAGLILKELKLRGLVRRVLILAPKGLIPQWLVELKDRFGEEVHYLEPSTFEAYRQFNPADSNPWKAYESVICSLDSVKPLDSRKGWTAEEVNTYNQDRLVGLASAGWDLIIFDEAHRVAGSGEFIARHALAKTLSEAAPYLLLLSATPHQGKTEAFHRLVSLLDKESFPDTASVTKDRVAPFVVRTEKRQAVDPAGKPLFKPRLTHLASIPWGAHKDQKELYEAVSTYVREGYTQALKTKKTSLGFLMILMQRLVSSSTTAILAALEKRLARLTEMETQSNSVTPTTIDGLEELDGQQQLELLLGEQIKAFKEERKELEALLRKGQQVLARGPDAKAEALLEWIYKLQAEEGDPELKVLIFTEFISTQSMLAEFLKARGFSVVCLNGSLSLTERKEVQKRFSEEARVMVSTDAGGEGLNLQFCHIVINFDLGWRPMAIEQRIGRLDRIGQERIVKAINFLLTDSVEFRVHEVLEQKLGIIFKEFGVDKTTDVLDSIEGGKMFDKLFLEALLHPEKLVQDASKAAELVLGQAKLHREDALFVSESQALPSEFSAISTQPVSDLLELLLQTHLHLVGGVFSRVGKTVELRWPDETETKPVMFPGETADPKAELIHLDHPRVRGLLSRLPVFTRGEPVSQFTFKGLPEGIGGYWSLWQLRLQSFGKTLTRLYPVFLTSEGKSYNATARFLWERLPTANLPVLEQLSPTASEKLYGEIYKRAQEEGLELYRQLKQEHDALWRKEQEKGQFFFAARRRLVTSIGLEEVRAFRLRQLEAEERTWQEGLKQKEALTPDLQALILAHLQEE